MSRWGIGAASYILKVFSKCLILIFLLTSLVFAKPIITAFYGISGKAKEIVLNFNDVISKAYTEITGVDPDISFEFYCRKLPYFGWSPKREFWNILDCSDEWFKTQFYQQYSHEIAQVFFCYVLPDINDDIDNGKYKPFFAPHYVLRPDEHISFSLDTVFWHDYAEKYGIDRGLGGWPPDNGYRISLDSEYFKVLKDFWAATVHHTEVDYHNFLQFSFYVGQMLYTKLYMYNKNFFRNFIWYDNKTKGSFKSVREFAERIIGSFKKGGLDEVDGIPVEEFVWEHPDFRRFREDYKRRYYFDIATVDYEKAMYSHGRPFVFYLTKINPSNFCFIVTSFRNYVPGTGVFNQKPDKAIEDLTIHYRIYDSSGRVVHKGSSKNVNNEWDYCSNKIPRLNDGVYRIEASVEVNGVKLEDSMDFVVKNEQNFYVNELPGYSYIVMRRARLGDRCYYIKMSLVGELLKLDEINEVSCGSGSGYIDVKSDGSVILRDVYYGGYFYDLELKHLKGYYWRFKVIGSKR